MKIGTIIPLFYYLFQFVVPENIFVLVSLFRCFAFRVLITPPFHFFYIMFPKGSSERVIIGFSVNCTNQHPRPGVPADVYKLNDANAALEFEKIVFKTIALNTSPPGSTKPPFFLN